MADVNKLGEQQDPQPTGRRDTYAPPELREFGPVGGLTQAGTMGALEGSQGMNPNMM